MEINFDSPKKVVLQEEKSKNISKLTVNRIVDLPVQKIVKCFCEELDEPIIIWQGASYDDIGQWSDTDVQSRLHQIFTS